MSVFGKVERFSTSFLVFAYQNATKFGAFSQICRTEEIGTQTIPAPKKPEKQCRHALPHHLLAIAQETREKEFGEGVVLRSSVFSVSVYFTNLW